MLVFIVIVNSNSFLKLYILFYLNCSQLIFVTFFILLTWYRCFLYFLPRLLRNLMSVPFTNPHSQVTITTWIRIQSFANLMYFSVKTSHFINIDVSSIEYDIIHSTCSYIMYLFVPLKFMLFLLIPESKTYGHLSIY